VIVTEFDQSTVPLAARVQRGCREIASG
jgi:hypothetical protein